MGSEAPEEATRFETVAHHCGFMPTAVERSCLDDEAIPTEPGQAGGGPLDVRDQLGE